MLVGNKSDRVTEREVLTRSCSDLSFFFQRLSMSSVCFLLSLTVSFTFGRSVGILFFFLPGQSYVFFFPSFFVLWSASVMNLRR